MTWPHAETAPTAKAPSASDSRRGTTESRGHAFTPAANGRITSCVRCGKPREAHQHPELQKAAFLSALNAAESAFLEGDQAFCVAQLTYATRLVRGL